MLCFDRLRWPWNLTEKAKAPYREFLAAHTGLVLQRLLKAQDTDSIKDLLALDVLDAAALLRRSTCRQGRQRSCCGIAGRRRAQKEGFRPEEAEV